MAFIVLGISNFQFNFQMHDFTFQSEINNERCKIFNSIVKWDGNYSERIDILEHL